MVKLFMCLAIHTIHKEFILMGWVAMPSIKTLCSARWQLAWHKEVNRMAGEGFSALRL